MTVKAADVEVGVAELDVADLVADGVLVAFADFGS